MISVVKKYQIKKTLLSRSIDKLSPPSTPIALLSPFSSTMATIANRKSIAKVKNPIASTAFFGEVSFF